jgi:hypothetical protein
MVGGKRLISWLHPCSTSNVALNTRTCAHGPLMGHPNWAGCDKYIAQLHYASNYNIKMCHDMHLFIKGMFTKGVHFFLQHDMSTISSMSL